MMKLSVARGIAARCWCDPETKNIEMDSRLADAFAKRLVQFSIVAEERIAAIENFDL